MTDLTEEKAIGCALWINPDEGKGICPQCGTNEDHQTRCCKDLAYERKRAEGLLKALSWAHVPGTPGEIVRLEALKNYYAYYAKEGQI